MTMIHVNASVEIHQLASIHTSMIHILASVSVSLTSVPLINTLTTRHVAAAATTIRPALVISISMIHHVNASVVTQKHVVQDNTMTTRPVTVKLNVKTLTNGTQDHKSVSVNRTTVQARTILTKLNVSASVILTLRHGVKRIMCTMSMLPVDAFAKRPALHPMYWTRKIVNVCAIKSAHLGIYYLEIASVCSHHVAQLGLYRNATYQNVNLIEQRVASKFHIYIIITIMYLTVSSTVYYIPHASAFELFSIFWIS